MTATWPLRGLSILIIDDDRLGAFRLHRALARAGARVATGDLALAADNGTNAAATCAASAIPVDRITVPWV